MNEEQTKQPVAAVAESLMRTCFDEANRIANHTDDACAQITMRALYNAGINAKVRLAAAAANEDTRETNAERVRSSAWVGTGAELMHDRPTVAGWWWWRNKGAWMMTEVHECPSGLYCPSLNMADSKANGHLGYRLWLGVWAGPLTPPPVPTNTLNNPCKE